MTTEQQQFASPANIAYVMGATGCPEEDAIESLIVVEGDCEKAIIDIRNIY